MSNEIATYSMILSKLSLGKSGTECPTKTQILAINSLIVIDNASTYGANECVKIDDIRKKVETWNYYLTVSPTSMSFGAGGGSKSFTVSSYKRKVLDGVEQSGDTSVSLKSTTISGTGFSLSGTTVSASANEITSNRTGTVTITQNESNKTVTISLSQDGDDVSSYGEWTISVSASPTSVSSSGGTSTITASAKRTVYWVSGDVTEETGNPTLSTNVGSLSSTSSPSTLTLGENTSTSSRTATIKATHGGKSATCTVTQAGAEPTIEYVFTISPWQVNVGASGGTGDIGFTSYKLVNGNQISLGYSIDSSTLPSWATYSNGRFTISSNSSTSSRSANVYFTQSESGKRDYATISQSGYVPPADEYVFEIADSSSGPYGSSVSWTLPASGSLNKDIYFRSKKNGENVGWSASSNASWIIVVRDYPDFYWEYENNNTAYSRSGKITFTQEGSGKKVYLNLTQEGKPQITFTATVAGKNIHTQSWDVPTTAKTVSAVLPFPSSWSTSDEFEVKLRHNDMSDGSWTSATQTGTMANYDRKSSITIENNRDSSVTFTVEYWFKGMDYVFHMWPADNTSGVYTSGTQSVDLQIMSRFFKEQHPLKVQSQPEWCTAYISGSDGNGIYNIDLLIQSNPLTQSRTGTIVFEQEDSGMTTSFTVSQGGATLKDNKLTITSLSYDTAFLFPAGITPVEDSNAYLSFTVPNTFTWKTSTGLTVNRGTIYAGELAKIYVRENNRYKLVKSFQLETGEQTITI